MPAEGFHATQYRVCGLRMAVQEHLESSSMAALPVVLVHGLGLSHRYMMPTAQALAGRHPTYVPDLPGFGDSEHPRAIPGVRGLADWLASWLDAAALSRVGLLGNSFGCQIIAELAARHPSRVVAAVLQGPTAPPEDRTWYRQWRRWRMNSPFNPPELGPMARQDYRRCGFVRLLATFQLSLRDHMEDKLDRILAPVLVVRGACDPICREGWAEQLAAGMRHGRLVLMPGVGHTLVYTTPEGLADLTSGFLTENEVRS